jgi:hypothetical protein
MRHGTIWICHIGICLKVKVQGVTVFFFFWKYTLNSIWHKYSYFYYDISRCDFVQCGRYQSFERNYCPYLHERWWQLVHLKLWYVSIRCQRSFLTRLILLVTFRRVSVTIVPVEKQWLLWIGSVCSLSYPVCKAHAPYYIVILLSHKRHDFRKKVIESKICVFWFSLQLLCETFLILWRTHRDAIINVHWFKCKVPVILVGF